VDRTGKTIKSTDITLDSGMGNFRQQVSLHSGMANFRL
jgi:hypothetical protein